VADSTMNRVGKALAETPVLRLWQMLQRTPAGLSGIPRPRMPAGRCALRRRRLLAASLAALCAACTTRLPVLDREAAAGQVSAVETAFAQTLARRDHAAFLAFVAEDAVFLNGGQPLRGKAAIGAHWQRFHIGPTPPFSWRPDHVEVAGSGTLAQTTGPVFAPDGKLIARFYSTWRLDPDGQWRIVFDDGYDVCGCPAR
jgi:uncharacterized protein (TIGR02246 family)